MRNCEKLRNFAKFGWKSMEKKVKKIDISGEIKIQGLKNIRISGNWSKIMEKRQKTRKKVSKVTENDPKY